MKRIKYKGEIDDKNNAMHKDVSKKKVFHSLHQVCPFTRGSLGTTTIKNLPYSTFISSYQDTLSPVPPPPIHKPCRTHFISFSL